MVRLHAVTLTFDDKWLAFAAKKLRPQLNALNFLTCKVADHVEYVQLLGCFLDKSDGKRLASTLMCL